MDGIILSHKLGKPEYRTKCLDCHKEYDKKIRSSHRDYYNKLNQQKKHENKKRAVELLGGKCQSCDYEKSLRALSFHHTEEVDKSRNISQMLDWAWEKIEIELKKCQLLCANCHMELHEKEEEYFPHQNLEVAK